MQFVPIIAMTQVLVGNFILLMVLDCHRAANRCYLNIYELGQAGQ